MVLWDITKCHPVTDFHCEDGSPSCFFCHCFLRNECPEEGSPSSKAASVQFQMDSDGMSLLPPSLSLSLCLSPSLGTFPLFRGSWQNLSMRRHPRREYSMLRTLTGRKQDISVCLSLSLLLPPCLVGCRIFCPFKLHKAKLSVALFHPVLSRLSQRLQGDAI